MHALMTAGPSIRRPLRSLALVLLTLALVVTAPLTACGGDLSGPELVALQAAEPEASAAAGGATTASATTTQPSRHEIRATVRSRLPQIRSCYERSLSERPGLRGTLVASFTIETTGRVRGDATVEGMGDAPGLGECVRGEVLQLTFAPPQAGPLNVRYPVVLEPGGGSGR
jgi:hypothetical protein